MGFVTPLRSSLGWRNFSALALSLAFQGPCHLYRRISHPEHQSHLPDHSVPSLPEKERSHPTLFLKSLLLLMLLLLLPAPLAKRGLGPGLARPLRGELDLKRLRLTFQAGFPFLLVQAGHSTVSSWALSIPSSCSAEKLSGSWASLEQNPQDCRRKLARELPCSALHLPPTPPCIPLT